MKKIAFQGVPGAYSEVALKEYFSDKKIESQGFALSEEVFDAVESGKVDYGFVPIENSIVGNVAVNLDLFFRNSFFIIGEYYLAINHCLLSGKESNLKDIAMVKSHPIAIAQCREFVNGQNIQCIPDYDTAGAALSLAREPQKNTAVIASKLCAEYYDLKVLEEDIQTIKNNITRFACFVKRENVTTQRKDLEKTSIAFSAHHHSGALLECLQHFADHKINLTRLESRPIIENPFEYIFFADLLGGIDSEKIQTCLTEMEGKAHILQILGSYPLAKMPSL